MPSFASLASSGALIAIYFASGLYEERVDGPKLFVTRTNRVLKEFGVLFNPATLKLIHLARPSPTPSPRFSRLNKLF